MDDDDDHPKYYLATNYVKAFGQAIPKTIMTELYGFYKQAEFGPCTRAMPYIWQFAELSKWWAWNTKRNLTMQEAQCGYVATLDSFHAAWEEAVQSVMVPEGIGPPVSTLAGHTGQSGEPQPGTIWHYAKLGDLDSMERLLKQVNAVEPQLGMTPLHFAVDRERTDAVTWLLSAGADANAQDKEGWTALHVAAACENLEIFEKLLAHGADRSIQDDDGQTADDIAPSNWCSPK